MTWLRRFRRGKRSHDDFKDPASEILRTADPDPANAETRWVLLYEKLKRIFEGWGYDDAHDLANLVIMRVCREITDIGDPDILGKALRIAPGIAANVERKRRRESNRELQGLDVEGVQRAEQLHSLIEQEREKLRQDCLKEALDKLSTSERELFLKYHNCLNSGLSTIECAEQLSMHPQTLKNKASIIKFKLTAHIRRCLKKFNY